MAKNGRLYHAALAASLLLCVIVHPTGIRARVSPLWGGLQAGPYLPGFTTIETYDASRTFQRKTDYFGNPLTGERARPIQVCIWYPARDTSGTPKMVYGEYNFAVPKDDRFVDHLSHLQYREIRYLHVLLNNNRGLVQDLMNVRMCAVRDAEPEEGPFPLIVYHPNLLGSYSENAVLCEYLATHGFVVATTHSVGPGELNPAANDAGLETLTRDKEFVVSLMRDEPYADRERLAVMGFGYGGSTSLLMQMRNTDVDAVVSLEGSLVSGTRSELTRQIAFYDAGEVKVPLLNIYSPESDQLDLSMVDSFTYAVRYSCAIEGARHADFTVYSDIARLLMPTPDSLPRPPSAYHIVCRHVLDFFKAYLDDDEDCLQRLVTSPDDSSSAAVTLSCAFTAAEEIPPTEAELISIIRDYGVDTAMQIVRKFRSLDPRHTLFREATFNELGYQLLRTSRVSDAVRILRMNTVVYPGSANVWDSFAEACVAAGDTEAAIESLKKALEVLPQDTTTDERIKEALRNNIPETLRRLQE
jgi:dienelactone hydrolase